MAGISDVLSHCFLSNNYLEKLARTIAGCVDSKSIVRGHKQGGKMKGLILPGKGEQNS
jgi:hypothetical protein